MKQKRVLAYCAGNRLVELKKGQVFRTAMDCCCDYSVHVFKPYPIPKGEEITCTDIVENLYGKFIRGLHRGRSVDIAIHKLELVK